MRSAGIGFCCVLLALLLLYSGLAVTEKGVHELLGLQRQPAAFRISLGPVGEPLLVFGGRPVPLNPTGWVTQAGKWRVEFRHFFGDRNLDKAER